MFAATPAFGEQGGKGPGPRAGGVADRKGAYRLDEVKILGSVERPEVVFILPRAKFGLLPLRTGEDWKERILRDGKAAGDVPE